MRSTSYPAGQGMRLPAPVVIGSDYSRHPMPGQTALNLRAVGETNVFPHAASCPCRSCTDDTES